MVDEDKREREQGRAARIGGTAVVAAGVVALLFAAAVAAFFLLAELLHGRWMTAVLSLLVLAALLWLVGRLVRVAANQNKDPLG